MIINLIYFLMFIIICTTIVTLIKQLKQNKKEIRLIEKKLKKKDMQRAFLVTRLIEIFDKEFKLNDEDFKEVSQLVKKSFHIKLKHVNEVDRQDNFETASVDIMFSDDDDNQFGLELNDEEHK
jgi:hypothetical protein